MAKWKENKVVGIAAVVIIVLGVAGIIFALQPKKEEVILMSSSTGKVVKMKLAPGVKFPLINPATGKKDLYPAMGYECANGYKFYVISKPGASAMVKCPKGGSTNVWPIGMKRAKKLK